MPNLPLNKAKQLFDLSHLGLIKIIGEQAKIFLQGQLTCNVEEINETKHSLAAYCNSKGRVLATLRLFLWESHYYFLTPANNINPLLQQLQKFAVFSKVSFENVSHAFNYVGLLSDEIKHIAVDENQIMDNSIILRVLDKQPRFIFISEENNNKNNLPKNIESSDQWRLLDIRAGIPNIYEETSGLFTPHMINYPLLNGVSFNKGCYVGQEIVARTEYLGQAKRHMHYLVFETNAGIGPSDKLFSPLKQEVGIVIDACYSNARTELLAVLQDGADIHQLKFG